MTDIPDVLKKIVDYKAGELARMKADSSLAEIQARIADLEDHPRGFISAIENSCNSGWTAIIAEVKKGSPSKGVIREDFDPLEIAMIYQNTGATCLSVLTDEHFFLGHLGYLALIREQVSLPLLRKDFIFDPYQIYQARAAGADAILLIAAMLDLSRLKEFSALARDLALDVLLEVHDEKELESALQTDCRLIGINNRNLRTFEVDIATSERLRALIPVDRLVVAESGITQREEIIRLSEQGVNAFLIGESLMREDDIAAKLAELLG
ncbi:indole-3-glycerol phosphate synthase TrpC [Geomesophilobacter sediminis]|uniref:Indole-3-glycerol phosphate synthase n=1 Tax=Geomesophilobacter sediminis TaxID=2798584 RepID=A0A8J7JAX5_9BACT|nr:indole-3-glycerol phosphate synthase TrpC [Geomesophilobacter sediminis]MBJ6723608.1 indole-3-glycerol phosphate synthase TrpC [Geomesophilobacter sediminis]